MFNIGGRFKTTVSSIVIDSRVEVINKHAPFNSSDFRTMSKIFFRTFCLVFFFFLFTSKSLKCYTKIDQGMTIFTFRPFFTFYNEFGTEPYNIL